MKLWIQVSWRLLNSGTGGNAYRGTGTAFDTDTKIIGPHTGDKYVALGEPGPEPFTLPVGEEIYAECASDFTRTRWMYDGGEASHTTSEANSALCGYTPPLSCELGAISVTQQATASGARLSVRYAGSANGAVYYALDGGAEGSSPHFVQVAPGPHSVRVRDAALAGCERTLSFTVEPPAQAPSEPPAPIGSSEGVDFVGQPLFYSLRDQAPGAQVELTVWAERGHYQADFAPVLTLRKLADSQGQVRFRLDTLLLPLLAAWVPPAGQPVNQVTQLASGPLLNYFVRTSSLAPGAGALPDYQVSALRTALRGGLPAEWQALDYFTWRTGDDFDDPPFLSWQPTGPGTYAQGLAKEVVPRQPEWLCWLCPPAYAGAQLRVRRAYAMSETAQPVYDYEPLERPVEGWGCRLLVIPLRDSRAGFAQLRVRLEAADGTPLSPEARYRFVEPSPRTRFLLFTNSLGGLDTLRCEGRLEAALEATADALELPPTGPAASAPAAQSRVGALTSTRKLRLNAGWLEPEELAWLQDLVLSRELWQQVGGQLRPLDWPKRSLSTYSDEPGLRGLVLDFDYAYPFSAYAPVPYA